MKWFKRSRYYLVSYIAKVADNAFSHGNLWVRLEDSEISYFQLRVATAKEFGFKEPGCMTIINAMPMKKWQFEEFKQGEGVIYPLGVEVKK